MRSQNVLGTLKIVYRFRLDRSVCSRTDSRDRVRDFRTRSIFSGSLGRFVVELIWIRHIKLSHPILNSLDCWSFIYILYIVMRIKFPSSCGRRIGPIGCSRVCYPPRPDTARGFPNVENIGPPCTSLGILTSIYLTKIILKHASY